MLVNFYLRYLVVDCITTRHAVWHFVLLHQAAWIEFIDRAYALTCIAGLHNYNTSINTLLSSMKRKTLSISCNFFYKVRPNSQGCLETVHDNRYPKLFKITFVNGRRHVRLATVVYIHKDASKNPVEWTHATVPMNTDQVTLFQHMIEDIEPQKGYEEKWRYISDLPLNSPSHNAEKSDGLHPRHMKIVFVTPVGSKLCLRPSQTKESVLSVKRHHTNSSVSVIGNVYTPFFQTALDKSWYQVEMFAASRSFLV